MGETADMMLDGTLCECCGVIMEDLIPEKGEVLNEPPGYPRYCSEECAKDRNAEWVEEEK